VARWTRWGEVRRSQKVRESPGPLIEEGRARRQVRRGRGNRKWLRAVASGRRTRWDEVRRSQKVTAGEEN